MASTRLVFGRRPKTGQAAFGYVDVNKTAQAEIQTIVEAKLTAARTAAPIAYSPDDAPDSGEVMVEPLSGIDQLFQPQAAWSLERAVQAISVTGKPASIGRQEVEQGGWTFYVLRATTSDGTDTIVIRALSPTHGLKHAGRTFTHFVSGELRVIKEPLVALTQDADAVIAVGDVFIFRPQALERLLIDADEIKARAPQIAGRFTAGLAAKLSVQAADLVEKACAENSNVGRRVERMNRTSSLQSMSIQKLRAGLADANLGPATFGKKPAVLELETVLQATALIEIAADLYYQPRFEADPRKVRLYRSVK